MVTGYWSADNLIWQVSIDHNMMPVSKKYKAACLCQSIIWRMAAILRDSTASHDNHEKITSRVSFSLLYGYGAPLGGPWRHQSSAIINNRLVKIDGRCYTLQLESCT